MALPDDDKIENTWYEKALRGQDEPLKEPREYTREEVVRQLVESFAKDAHYWSTVKLEKGRDNVAYRCDGVAFSILSMLDGCDIGMPGFLLSVNSDEEDAEWRIKRGINYYNPDEFVNSREMMHDLYHDVVRELEVKRIAAGEAKRDKPFEDIYNAIDVKPDSYLPNLNPLQVSQRIVKAAHRIASTWGDAKADMSNAERCHAVAHGVLGIFEGKYEDIPQMTISPVVPREGRNSLMPREEIGNYESRIMNWPYEERVMVNGLPREYAEEYERFKPRFAASAKDLFD